MSNDNDGLPIPDFLDRNPNKEVATTNGTNDDAKLSVVAGGVSDSPLPILENTKRALAEAKSVDEVKRIRDEAIGLIAYARQASDRQLEEDATVIRMEAERKLGQIMRDQKETIGLNKGGRPKTGAGETPVFNQLPTLADVGIGKALAKRARAAAAPSEEEFQGQVKAKRESVRNRTGPRTRPVTVKARATTRRRGSPDRTRTHLEERLSQISTVCRYDAMEIPADLNAAKIGSAISTLRDDIGELNKWIDRLEEARSQK